MDDRVLSELRGGSVVWSEEFNGAAGLPVNPATWQPEVGGHGWGNQELQYYTDSTENASLDGSGNLAIVVRRPDRQQREGRFGGCEYTSARLITKDRVHGPGYAGAAGITASHEADASLADDFHVYSVYWEPERIRWYLDDELYSTLTPDDLQGNPWVFDHDFFLLVNVAVGGTFSQRPDSSASFPTTMLVDYVRVDTATSATPS